MADLLGKNVLNPDGTKLGTITAVFDPNYFLEFHYTADRLGNWYGQFPDWLSKPVCIVRFNEPQRNVSRLEVSRYYDIPLEHVTDKIYNALSSVRTFMYMPVDALKLED